MDSLKLATSWKSSGLPGSKLSVQVSGSSNTHTYIHVIPGPTHTKVSSMDIHILARIRPCLQYIYFYKYNCMYTDMPC